MTDEAARIRATIAAAFPTLAIRSIRFLAAGWDSTVWQINDELVFRFPKRAEVATWLRHEIAVLPRLGPTLPVSVPRFAYVAEPSATFPYSFVGYRKLPGLPLADAPATIIQPERLAAQIGAFLTALHRFPVTDAVALGVPYTSPEAWRGQYAAMLAELRMLFPRMTTVARERTELLFAGYLANPLHIQIRPRPRASRSRWRPSSAQSRDWHPRGSDRLGRSLHRRSSTRFLRPIYCLAADAPHPIRMHGRHDFRRACCVLSRPRAVSYAPLRLSHEQRAVHHAGVG